MQKIDFKYQNGDTITVHRDISNGEVDQWAMSLQSSTGNTWQVYDHKSGQYVEVYREGLAGYDYSTVVGYWP